MHEDAANLFSKMLDGFNGNLTNKKWASMNDCSPDTALRDINELVDRGVLVSSGAGGRSTHYVLINLKQ
jgi:Fic family protein